MKISLKNCFILSWISIEPLSNFLKVLLRDGSLKLSLPLKHGWHSDAAGQLGHSSFLPVYNSTIWFQTYFLLVLREAILLWYKPENFSSVSDIKQDFQQSLTWLGPHKDSTYKNLVSNLSDLSSKHSLGSTLLS